MLERKVPDHNLAHNKIKAVFKASLYLMAFYLDFDSYLTCSALLEKPAPEFFAVGKFIVKKKKT